MGSQSSRSFLVKIKRLLTGDARLIYIEKADAVNIHSYKSKEYHGLTNTPEYKTWTGMKDRCNRVTGSHYKDYGARGIKVCERWNNSFTLFLEDMGERPTHKHSIDRIDNDGDYEPSNCRWATRSEQNTNKSYSNYSTGVRGVYYNKAKDLFLAYIFHNKQRQYLGSFKRVEDAILAREEALNGTR